MYSSGNMSRLFNKSLDTHFSCEKFQRRLILATSIQHWQYLLNEKQNIFLYGMVEIIFCHYRLNHSEYTENFILFTKSQLVS